MEAMNILYRGVEVKIMEELPGFNGQPGQLPGAAGFKIILFRVRLSYDPLLSNVGHIARPPRSSQPSQTDMELIVANWCLSGRKGGN